MLYIRSATTTEPAENPICPVSYMKLTAFVGQAILPAAGFEPAGPAGERVRSLDRLPHPSCTDQPGLSEIRTDTTLIGFRDGQHLVGANVAQGLHGSAGPPDFDFRDLRCSVQAKMHAAGA